MGALLSLCALFVYVCSDTGNYVFDMSQRCMKPLYFLCVPLIVLGAVLRASSELTFIIAVHPVAVKLLFSLLLRPNHIAAHSDIIQQQMGESLCHACIVYFIAGKETQWQGVF